MRRRTLVMLVLLLALLSSRGRPEVASRVDGIVVDAATGLPLAGALVRLNLAAPEPYSRTTLTDDTGVFRFDGLTPQPEEEYFVTCQKDGYVSYRPSYHYGFTPPGVAPSLPAGLYRTHGAMEEALGVFRVQEGTTVHRKIELRRGGRLVGHVGLRTPQGTEPLQRGFMLMKRREPQERLFSKDNLAVEWVEVDCSGAFDLQGLAPSSTYSISSSPKGHASQQYGPMEVSSSHETRVDVVFDLSDPAGVQGDVKFPDGRPVGDGLGLVLVSPNTSSSADAARLSVCDSDIHLGTTRAWR